MPFCGFPNISRWLDGLAHIPAWANPGLLLAFPIERQDDEISLSVGHRRSWRLHGLCRDRLDLLAACLPAADMGDTGWSRASISLAMTLDFITMGIASFAWGLQWIDMVRGSYRSPAAPARSRACEPRLQVLEFQLLYGIVVGAGGGAIFAPIMATVTGWFDRQRSLAVSLVSAGMGMAPMTVAPIAARLVSAHDWRFAQLSIGIAAWALLLPTALLIRRSPGWRKAAGAVPLCRRYPPATRCVHRSSRYLH